MKRSLLTVCWLIALTFADSAQATPEQDSAWDQACRTLEQLPANLSNESNSKLELYKTLFDLLQQGYVPQTARASRLLYHAAGDGELGIIRWLQDLCVNSKLKIRFNEIHNAFVHAASRGHIHVLQYFARGEVPNKRRLNLYGRIIGTSGFPLPKQESVDRAFVAAALKGQLAVVTWLAGSDTGLPKPGDYAVEEGFIEACHYEQFEILNWLADNNTDLRRPNKYEAERAFRLAYDNNRPNLINWFLNNAPSFLRPENGVINRGFVAAAAQGNIDVLQVILRAPGFEATQLLVNEAFLKICRSNHRIGEVMLNTLEWFLNFENVSPQPSIDTIVLGYRELQNANWLWSNTRRPIMNLLTPRVPENERRNHAPPQALGRTTAVAHQPQPAGLAFKVHEAAKEIYTDEYGHETTVLGAAYQHIMERIQGHEQTYPLQRVQARLSVAIQKLAPHDQPPANAVVQAIQWHQETMTTHQLPHQDFALVFTFLDQFYPEKGFQHWFQAWITECSNAYDSINPQSCLKGIYERIYLSLRGIDPKLDQILGHAEFLELMPSWLSKNWDLEGENSADARAKAAAFLHKKGFGASSTITEAGAALARHLRENLWFEYHLKPGTQLPKSVEESIAYITKNQLPDIYRELWEPREKLGSTAALEHKEDN